MEPLAELGWDGSPGNWEFLLLLQLLSEAGVRKIPRFPQRNSAVPALGAGAVVSLGLGLRVLLTQLFREFLFGETMVCKVLSTPEHSVIEKRVLYSGGSWFVWE